jgi:4,5-dihydroxyphthalate decarboxylase
MLERGDIDAIFTPRMPGPFITGSSKIRRLFHDYRRVEADYFARTRIFPIMHTVVIRRDVYERDRWIAQSLVKALTEAKRMCAATIYNTAALPYMLPWMNEEIESVRQLMGEDWWPYGLEPNRKTLETFLRYAAAQGIATRPLTVEALFAPESLDTFKI